MYLRFFSKLALYALLLILVQATVFAGGNLGNLGTYYKWHKVEIVLPGPSSSVTASPNPFEISVNVTFTGPGGTFSIPAFYDGNGSGGTSGNVWKVRFSANAIGSWTFSSSSANATLNGYTGSFSVADAPASAPNFFKWGRLKYVGGHYLKFTDGPFWIKAGVDDPENFLGNPFGAGNWAAKKAQIDKVAAKKANSVYLILNTVDGDGKDVWPWWGSTASEAKSNGSRFNPAKLLQWEDFFAYCNNKGIVLHLVFDDDSCWSGYNRTLFYREMIARFGYLPGIIWNVGEEANEMYSNSQQIDFAGMIKSMNSLGSPVTVHRTSTSTSNWPFIGNANFDFTSIQTNPGGGKDFTTATLDNNNAIIINNRNASVSAGRPIAVMIDEPPRVTTVNTTTRLKLRSQVLYPIFLGGGNFELHYQDQFTQGGSTTFDTLAPMLDDMRIAREFLETLPFDQMSPNNSLLSSTSGNFCFAKPGLAYGIYMTNGTTINLNLTGVKGAFQVKWHNVTTGATTNGPIILGGAQRSLGAPGYSGDVACSVVRTVTYPGASWSSATAADLGVDSSKLTAFSGSAGGNGIVIKDGYVVHQWGSPSSTLNWASASKPTNVTALFIAIAEGRTTLDKPIYPDYWSSAKSKDRNITFRHMANMMSGYMRPENPGAAWSYNDYNVNLFTKTLYQKVFGSNPQSIMTNRLSALQFQDNPQWNTGTNYGRLTSCSGRDFARIGWMWANSGKWNASTIVPSTFFDQYCKVAVSSSVPRSSGSDGSDYLGVGTYGGGTNQTTDGPGEYGFFWWNNQNGWWADAPRDTFMADGHGGKECVVIMPSLGLVVSGNGNWGEGTSSKRNTLFKYLKESVVTPGADSQLPSIPYNVKATALSGNTAIQITWTKSADNLGVQGYKIFRNGVQIGTSPRDSFTDTSVAANTTYLYTVSAYDYSNNNSAQSTPARIIMQSSDNQPPSVPTDVQAAGLTTTSILVSWTASTDNIAVAGYKIFRNGTQIDTSMTPSYIDQGLNPDTTYSYTVSAYDAAGNNSAQSSPAAVATTPPADLEAPSVPTGVSAVALSPGSIQVSWTASTDNVAVTGYKIYRDGALADVSETTSYIDTGLDPETVYSYTVSAFDLAGNESAQSSPAAQATTPADEEPPSVPTDVVAVASSASEIHVSWTPSTDNGRVAGYKIFRDSVQIGMADFEPCAFSDSGLQPNTTYYYTVSAYDAAGNESVQSLPPAEATTWVGSSGLLVGPFVSGTGNWNTLNNGGFEAGNMTGWPGQVTPPGTFVASNARAAEGNWSAKSQATAAGGFSAWQQNVPVVPGEEYIISGYFYTGGCAGMAYLDLNDIANDPEPRPDIGVNEWQFAWKSFIATSDTVAVRLVRQTTDGVDAGVFYDEVAITPISQFVPPSTDIEPPSVPTNVGAISDSCTSIQVSWTASTDNIGVAGYKVFRNGVLIGTSATNNYSDAGLEPVTSYSYTVAAFDAAGNTSAQSAPPAIATTLADTEAPSVPSNVNATAISGTSVQITWLASADNVAVVGYKIYRNGAELDTTASLSYQDNTAESGATYSYTVAAYDAANNTSAQSSVAEVTTPDTMPPSIPTNVQATALSGARISLTWTASTDNVGVAGYYVFRNGNLVTTTDTTSYVDTWLQPETSYSYSVSAYDDAGEESEQSSPAAVATTLAALSISDAKLLGDTMNVTLVSKIVSAVFSDCFYIKEPGHFMGIKVVPDEMPAGLGVQRTVDVDGTMATSSSNDERFISGTVKVRY